MDTIKKALITEKTMKLAQAGLYTFIVSKTARKPEIEKAIEDKFAVDVISVKTANFKKERKMQRARKGVFTVPGYKKAIVELKGDQKIDVFTEALKSAVPEETETKEEVKEKKSLLKGTKVKIEKSEKKARKQ